MTKTVDTGVTGDLPEWMFSVSTFRASQEWLVDHDEIDKARMNSDGTMVSFPSDIDRTHPTEDDRFGNKTNLIVATPGSSTRRLSSH